MDRVTNDTRVSITTTSGRRVHTTTKKLLRADFSHLDVVSIDFNDDNAPPTVDEVRDLFERLDEFRGHTMTTREMERLADKLTTGIDLPDDPDPLPSPYIYLAEQTQFFDEFYSGDVITIMREIWENDGWVPDADISKDILAEMEHFGLVTSDHGEYYWDCS